MWQGVIRWSNECAEAKVRSKTKTRKKSQHNVMRNGNQGVSTRGQRHREEVRQRKERWTIKHAMWHARCLNRHWPRKSWVLLQRHKAKGRQEVTRWNHECKEAKVRSKTDTREKSQHNAMCNGNQGVSTRGQRHREDPRQRNERRAIKKCNVWCEVLTPALTKKVMSITTKL